MIITVHKITDSKNREYKMLWTAPTTTPEGVKVPSRKYPVHIDDMEALDIQVGDKVDIDIKE